MLCVVLPGGTTTVPSPGAAVLTFVAAQSKTDKHSFKNVRKTKEMLKTR